MACNCPISTTLTIIPNTTCPEELGQFQRFILARQGFIRFDTVDPTSAKQIPASIQGAGNLPSVLAPWTILLAEPASDRAIVTPLIGGDPVINPGDQITQGGGDNSTLNGEVYHVAYNPADASFRFDSLTAAQTKAIKKLICEKLEIFMVNADGDIIGERDQVDTDLFHGFKATNVSLGGRSVQGFGTRDSNVFSFQLDDDWDTKFEKVTPTDFNALTFS